MKPPCLTVIGFLVSGFWLTKKLEPESQINHPLEPVPDEIRRFPFSPLLIAVSPGKPPRSPYPRVRCAGSACRAPRRCTVPPVLRDERDPRRQRVERLWFPRRCERKARTATAGYRRARM